MVIFTGMIASQRPSSGSQQSKLSRSRSVPEESRGRFRSSLSNTNRRRLLIVKFGGSSLANARRISVAAHTVAREYSRGTRIVVVVSAVGKTTDRLVELANGTGGIQEPDRDDILAMGERTSARIFAASLKSRGIQARYFDPSDRDWPIFTDDRFSDANPLPSTSVERIRRYVKPLLTEGIVPVIGGFIGRTRDGRVSTLGRGGSDTTALLLAKALNADEVVLVTNANGIMSGDPKLIGTAKLLRRIDMKTLVGIADSGTKFIHRKALRFKDPAINIRVVPYTAGTLRSWGTTITGGPLPELEVRVHNPDPAASVTLVGKALPKNPQLIHDVAEIARSSLLAVSQDSDSVILYLAQTRSLSHIISKLHNAVLGVPGGVAAAARTGMALIRVKGVGLEATPGVTAKISETLRVNKINIFGILTITSSVLVFVDWKLRATAAGLIRNSLEAN